jgi:hypothetical protein
MAIPAYAPQGQQIDWAAMGIPTTGAGQYDWIAQLFGGAGNLATAGLDMRTAGQAAGMADPWSGERGQYQTALNQYMGANTVNPAASTARSSDAYSQLQALLANPQSLTKMPGYQFGLNQAMEAVNRGAGASGLLNSGNRLAALQDRGEGYARDWQKQMYSELLGNVGAATSVDQLGLGAQQQGYGQLANLAGVNAGSPQAAAAALLGGRQNQSNSIGAGIGGIANSLGGWLPGIQRLLGLGGGDGTIDLTQGGGNIGATDDWIKQVFGIGEGGGSGYLPDPSDILGGSDFSDLFGGASGFDIFG